MTILIIVTSLALYICLFVLGLYEINIVQSKYDIRFSFWLKFWAMLFLPITIPIYLYLLYKKYV